MTKLEIIGKLREEVAALEKTLSEINHDRFFQKPGNKWSIAENVQHLVLSAKPLNLAFSLPGILFRLLFGKPYRKSNAYDEIVKRYEQLLKEGAVATGSYIPKSVPLQENKNELVSRFKRTYETLSSRIQQWDEDQLDKYFLPHPFLGKLTQREMLYFTIHHVGHHHNTIKAIHSAS